MTSMKYLGINVKLYKYKPDPTFVTLESYNQLEKNNNALLRFILLSYWRLLDGFDY